MIGCWNSCDFVVVWRHSNCLWLHRDARATGDPRGLSLVRIRHFGHVLFVVALPASEIPHFFTAHLGFSTLLAWGQGDLTGLVGVILVSAAGLLLIGLFELLRHALRARSVVHKVLRQHGRRPARRRAWWVRLLLFPFPWRPPSVIRTGPIFMVRILGNGWTYTDHGMRNLPAQCWRIFMAVAIFLVGTGGRLARCPINSPRAGGRVLITTYRLRPRFGFTEHLADARAVLTWLMKMQMFTVVTRLRWSWLVARPRKPDGTLRTHSGQTRAPAG